MLSPATGEGASPRIGRSDGCLETSSGLVFGDGLPRESCGGSACTTALAFFFGSGAGAFFGIFSEEAVGLSAGAVCFSGAEVCFFLSSASSDWMRCSIISSFLSKASFASPSAALAPLQTRMDIAVAASSAFCLESRSGLNIDTDTRGNWCNDIRPPICGDQKLRDFLGTYYRWKIFLESEMKGRDWNLSNLQTGTILVLPDNANKLRRHRTRAHRRGSG